jgi:uncharacterized membrane protein YdbT with pleckstrin-like domain
MANVSASMMPNEQVLYVCRSHSIGFVWVAFRLLLGLFLVAKGSAVLGLVLIIWSGFAGLGQMFNYNAAVVRVTNMRVVAKVGFIRRESFEMPISKVETIDIRQGLFGQMFGYGTLVLRGSGGTPATFKNIAEPAAFQRAVNQARADSQR